MRRLGGDPENCGERQRRRPSWLDQHQVAVTGKDDGASLPRPSAARTSAKKAYQTRSEPELSGTVADPRRSNRRACVHGTHDQRAALDEGDEPDTGKLRTASGFESVTALSWFSCSAEIAGNALCSRDSAIVDYEPHVSARFRRTLDALRRWAVLLDSAFRVPGTTIRFGLDAILGLIPGFGDSGVAGLHRADSSRRRSGGACRRSCRRGWC